MTLAVCDEYVPPIKLTAAAFSKAYRMCSKRALREGVLRGWTGETVVFQEADSEIFHVKVEHHGESYWAVVAHGWNSDQGNTLTVITQMHGHRDYRADPTTERVASIPNALGFADFMSNDDSPPSASS